LIFKNLLYLAKEEYYKSDFKALLTLSILSGTADMEK